MIIGYPVKFHHFFVYVINQVGCPGITVPGLTDAAAVEDLSFLRCGGHNTVIQGTFDIDAEKIFPGDGRGRMGMAGKYDFSPGPGKGFGDDISLCNVGPVQWIIGGSMAEKQILMFDDQLHFF